LLYYAQQDAKPENKKKHCTQLMICAAVLQEFEVYFESGYHNTRVYILSDLRAGHDIAGPVIIMDTLSGT
jgi:N-methylhydantoinase A/oxoprolinase/acetone carboxylase beta subunit